MTTDHREPDPVQEVNDRIRGYRTDRDRATDPEPWPDRFGRILRGEPATANNDDDGTTPDAA